MNENWLTLPGFLLIAGVFGALASFPDQPVDADHPVNKSGKQHQTDQYHQVGGEKTEHKVERVIQAISGNENIYAEQQKKYGNQDEHALPQPPQVPKIQFFQKIAHNFTDTRGCCIKKTIRYREIVYNLMVLNHVEKGGGKPPDFENILYLIFNNQIQKEYE